MFDGPFRRLCAALAVLGALALAGCSSKGDSPAYIQKRMSVGGLDRSYTLYVPPGARKGEPRPLVVALHGSGGSGRDMDQRHGIGLHGLADEEGYIAVFPDAVERNWNDGRSRTGYRAHREHIDDVAFIRKLIERLSRRYPIDARRVYLVGESGGGMMALRLACEAADLFAGIAVVSAAMPEKVGERCRPSRAVPVIVMNGTEDRLLPYYGGPVRFEGRRYGRVWSTRKTVNFFARRNGCRHKADRIRKRDRDDEDGTEVTMESYRRCRTAGGVALYTIGGGGHSWPGSRKPFPRSIVGRTSHEFDATTVIWEFFRRHAG